MGARYARLALRRERVFRDHANPFDLYDDEELITKYRFPSCVIVQLTDQLEQLIADPSNRSGAVLALLWLLTVIKVCCSQAGAQVTIVHVY
ncbi:hypothetical protein ElyMa_001438800 [Elysia marginata]|uniref:Uncharacterized protein n=1 Tax=Elysia marginata TaxID=1093978 RepID=A0AAV4IX87_9GAST|nr:hypothetical protein ElyMa_001438800 [Elysia marginata]